MPIHSKTLLELDLKPTKARIAMLEIFEKEAKPIDVEQIIQALSQKNIEADTVTVYRILDIFYKNHLINKLEFGEGKFRYEMVREEHHHVICEKCGRVEDVIDCPIGELEKNITQKQNFIIKRHTLEFFGVCSNCS